MFFAELLIVLLNYYGFKPEYVIDGRTGLLRSSGDIEGLTADLIRLLQDPAERKRLSAAARAHIAANFNWACLAQQIEQAYFSKNY